MKKKAFNRSLKLNKTTITKLNKKASEIIKGGVQYQSQTCDDGCIDKTDFFDCEPYETYFPYCS